MDKSSELSRKERKILEKKNKALEKAYHEIAKEEYITKVNSINNLLKKDKEELYIKEKEIYDNIKKLKSRVLSSEKDSVEVNNSIKELIIELNNIKSMLENYENSENYKKYHHELEIAKNVYDNKINSFKVTERGRTVSINNKYIIDAVSEIDNNLSGEFKKNDSEESNNLPNYDNTSSNILEDLESVNNDTKKYKFFNYNGREKKDKIEKARESINEQINNSSIEDFAYNVERSGILTNIVNENEPDKENILVESGIEKINEYSTQGMPSNSSKVNDLVVNNNKNEVIEVGINQDKSEINNMEFEKIIDIDNAVDKKSKSKINNIFNKMKGILSNEEVSNDKSHKPSFKVEVTTKETTITEYNYENSERNTDDEKSNIEINDNVEDRVVMINPENILSDNIIQVEMSKKEKKKELRRLKIEEKKNNRNLKKLDKENKKIAKTKDREEKNAKRDLEKLAIMEEKRISKEKASVDRNNKILEKNKKIAEKNLRKEEKLRNSLERKEQRKLVKLSKKERKLLERSKKKEKRLLESGDGKNNKVEKILERDVIDTNQNQVESISNIKTDESVFTNDLYSESMDKNNLITENISIKGSDEVDKDELYIEGSNSEYQNTNKDKTKNTFRLFNILNKNKNSDLESVEIKENELGRESIINGESNYIKIEYDKDVDMLASKNKELLKKQVDEESEQLKEKFRIKEERKKRKNELKTAKLKAKLDKKKEKSKKKEESRRERLAARERAEEIKRGTKERLELEKNRIESSVSEKKTDIEKIGFVNRFLSNRKRINEEKNRIKSEILATKIDKNVSSSGDGSLNKEERKQLKKQLKDERKRIKLAERAARADERKRREELIKEDKRDKKLENIEKDRTKAEKAELKKSFKNTKVAEKARRREAKELSKLEEKRLSDIRKAEKAEIAKERKIESDRIKKEKQYKKELQSQQKYKAKQQRRLLREETKVNKRALKIEMPKVNIVNIDQEENLGGSYQWDAESGSFRSSEVQTFIDIEAYDLPEQLPRR
jgi:hypothetical protein